jgi:hypothetical protein
MGFQISPGVAIKEVDLSAIIPAVATTGGATVGYFPWGPVLDPQMISSEQNLAKVFGTPNASNFNSFFTAANFLAYSNSMLVTRVIGPLGVNACVSGTPVLIKGDTDYELNYEAGEGSVGEYAARCPGVLGNSLSISVADANSFGEWRYQSLFSRVPGTSEYVTARGGLNDELFVVVVDTNGKFSGVKGQVLETFQTSKAAGAKAFDGTTSYYATALMNGSSYAYWMDHPSVGITGTDDWGSDLTVNRSFKTINKKLAVTVTHGTVGSGCQAVVSKVGSNGEILAVTVTNGGTLYDTATAAVAVGSGATFNVVVSGGIVTRIDVLTQGLGYFGGLNYDLVNGADDYTVVDGDVMAGYDLYRNAEQYDLALVALGSASSTVANYVISNIAETRKDCVVFVSPTDTGASPIIGSDTTALNKLLSYKTAVNIDSSYGFMDTGCKYQYDKYNDKFRWITLNGDIAGLCAFTDAVTDPWFSPGGLNRGKIKNCVKLAVNPDLTMRDALYSHNINPVTTFPGNGTVLFGDKTMQTKPSAFDRINVRRLFIVLEKAIAIASKYQLFEINDAFTQATFRGMVEPFLRDVKGRRGVYDYLVVCDSSNNTPQVVDANEFRASIFIKPARSINFITLSFVATRTDATFSELVGQVV